MKNNVLVVLALLFVSLPLFALDADRNIDNLRNDLHALSRVTAVAEDLGRSRQVLLAITDANIETLRGPRGDGTFQWASLQREEGGRATDEKTIEHVHSEPELRYITLTAPNAYRAEIVVPRKRSTFAANNRVWVRNVIVDATGFDGKTLHHEIPVNAWVNPGDATGVPLPDITKSAKAIFELGVESGSKAAVAQVALVQAKLVDDARSTYYPAVVKLLQIRELAAARDMNRGALKNTIDEAILALPGELEKRAAEQARLAEERRQAALTGTTTGMIAAGDATSDVTRALGEIARMLGGTLQEQTDARTRLEALLARLRPQGERRIP
jgi:hypothetical protein